MADFINKYFAEIGGKLAEPLIEENHHILKEVDNLVWPEEEESNKLTADITQEEPLPFIKSINTSKSSAIDGVTSMIYKDVFLSMPTKIFKIFNASLKTLKFPKKLKNGTVIPLPKVTAVKEPTDLRPISLLPLPGKLLERIMCARLNQFLDIRNPYYHRLKPCTTI